MFLNAPPSASKTPLKIGNEEYCLSLNESYSNSIEYNSETYTHLVRFNVRVRNFLVLNVQVVNFHALNVQISSAHIVGVLIFNVYIFGT